MEAAERLSEGCGVMRIPIYGRAGVVGHALVDDQDYERLAAFRWHLSQRGYVVRNLARIDGRRPSPRSMHRDVLGLEPGDSAGLQADHRNHDKLDNQRVNLRLTTPSGNGANRRGPDLQSQTGLRGVSYHRQSGKWHAVATLNGRRHSLRYFDTPEEAAEAAARFRREHMPTSEMDRRA
jgi:hypothetical protein